MTRSPCLRSGAAVLVLLAAAWIYCALPVEAVAREAATLEVSVGESIQAAIDEAEPGDVVSIGAGVFRGSLVVDRSVTLRGAPEGTTISGEEYGAAVRIVGEDVRVRIERLTVTGGRGFRGHGIQTEGDVTVELIDVTSTGNAWCGVWATDRSTLVLENCRLAENHTFGLYTWDFAQVELRSCTIAGNGTHGILALHVSEVTLVDCLVTGNWSGVWAWDGVRLRAKDTEVTDNATQGIVAQNAALIHLTRCNVARNADSGLWFSDSSRGVLSESVVRGNGRDGVLIERDGIVEFYRCTILDNAGVGIRAAASECVGGFDTANPYKGWVKGEGNVVPGPTAEHGNREAALCPPYPGSLWPPAFLDEDSGGPDTD
jgi:nitrous oxidase accessory protein NosD